MVHGVLLVIDRTGIPVLVRPYGQVQKPPSAAVGIGSAIFHAAKANPHVELRVLASEHRKAVYYQSKHELLAVLVSESSGNSNASTERMLELVCRLVELLVGPGKLGMGVDSSRLRSATQRHLAAIDYVVTQFTTDARLPFARPTYALEAKNERINQPSADLILGVWLRDGEIVAEVEASDRGSLTFSPADLVLMKILASSTKEAGIQILNVYPTVNEVEIAVKLARVESEMAENASLFLGIFNSNTAGDHIRDIVKSRTAEGGTPSDSTTHLEHIHQVFPALRHSVFLW
ncbi:hypothetical protein Poli38472_014842 [Pythium oligandrum]|uniref:Uncharacterized protein n=1 Tax=Pythium oligandrum TaxID=41045 RepID=A0A8K1C9G8_PYTOL|nr:hypothetical protein Poli38472_010304 [Pythium oligandrum]TMW60979.1 hypothetical protein Poli38472_014842 [Pythium oligandrum]|eukprot:TMW58745.1 hypothetical protein Poli38472_010304 [Pythium oligandrum]